MFVFASMVNYVLFRQAVITVFKTKLETKSKTKYFFIYLMIKVNKMDLRDNLMKLGYNNNQIYEDDNDIVFDMETQSTFKSQIRENQYFDSIRNARKQVTTYVKSSEFPVNFPDRRNKSFIELDEAFKQGPNKDYEQIAKKKYDNLFNIYRFPYEAAKKQNDLTMLNKNTVKSFQVSNLSSVQNENWAADDESVRKSISSASKPNYFENIFVNRNNN